MNHRSVVRLPWERRGPGSEEALVQRLGGTLALHLTGAVSPEVCARWSAGVEEARPHWNRDFDGEQFSLGRAWYTHLEQGRSHTYFAQARASDELVERFAPGLQAGVLALLSALVGHEVGRRAGWCGPGVHVFPGGREVAREGGVIHSDVEGLSAAHIAERVPALSAVLMLRPPERGGGLRLWDAHHLEATALDEESLDDVASETLAYCPGDLVVFDSYRLHQIQAFSGRLDRLSVTAHAVRLGPGRWEAWF